MSNFNKNYDCLSLGATTPRRAAGNWNHEQSKFFSISLVTKKKKQKVEREFRLDAISSKL